MDQKNVGGGRWVLKVGGGRWDTNWNFFTLNIVIFCKIVNFR